MATLKRDYLNKVAIKRNNLKYIYDNKYYNKWMRLSSKVDGLDVKEAEYIFRQWYATGQVCAFNAVGTDDLTLFAPFATERYDLYDYPVKAMPINTRNAMGFPKEFLKVNEEIVLGYALKSKKPIKSIIDVYINKIVDIEMIINTNLNTHKMPWIVVGNTDDEDKLKYIMKLLQEDVEELYLTAEMVEKLKVLVTNNPYIIDKLYAYKQDVENELNTFLGCDNSMTSMNRMLVDQVNANNQDINESQDLFKDTIQEFFDKCKEVLGKEISWKEDAFEKSMSTYDQQLNGQGGDPNE